MRGRCPAGPVRLLLLVASIFLGHAAEAGDERPGEFDFYVLSLSWSPTYCLDRGQRDRIQCGARPYAFVVHGLWPQFERGYPEHCRTGGPARISERMTDGLLDIMPSPSLIRYQWRKHGSCSGLDPAAYFRLVREARDVVSIPPPFVDVTDYMTVSPAGVERAFRAVNPGLPPDGIAVTCDAHRIKEVRICMTRELRFRGCPEVDRATCRQPQVVMPPVR